MKKAKAIKMFLKKIKTLKKYVYNPNRLEWHLDG